MIAKVTDNLKFCSKCVTVALLFAVISNFAAAKAPCFVESNLKVSCVLEQRQGPSDKNKWRDTNAFAIDQLYYSGGVLHNKALDKQSTPTEELEHPTGMDEKLMLNEDTSSNQSQGTSLESSSNNKIRGIFQNISKAGRKSIQKCLQFGTYDAKVDGIWGQQTHKAISNFKNVAHQLRKQRDEPSLFSKIKNVFSRKAVCHKLLNDTFG